MQYISRHRAMVPFYADRFVDWEHHNTTTQIVIRRSSYIPVFLCAFHIIWNLAVLQIYRRHIGSTFRINDASNSRYMTTLTNRWNSKQIELTWRPGKYSKITFIKNQNIYIKMRLFIITRNGRILTIMKWPSSQGRKKSSSTGNATWLMTWMDFEGNNRRPAISRENQHSHRTPERQNNYHAYSTGQKKSWSTDMVVNVTW